MDDIASKLSELLNSPEGIEQMKSLASTFLNNNQANAPLPEEPDFGQAEDTPFNMPDIDIGTIMKLSQLFNNNAEDDRSKLLLSLKPHLSKERRERVDQAVKILKLIALWPVISESGILKNFF